MRRVLYLVVPLFALFTLSACSVKKDVIRIEGKIDQLIAATNRSTLEQIFGEQAGTINQKIDGLGSDQRQEFAALQQGYQQGNMTLEDVREKMITLMGGGDREVYTPSGIVLRDLEGAKTGSVPNGTKVSKSRKLSEEEIPASISERAALRKYSWGVGEIEGAQVVFPWELTISSFTKEIVEATARRTAQEFIRMGGDQASNRPIFIQIETPSSDNLKVKTNSEEDEVYVLPPK